MIQEVASSPMSLCGLEEWQREHDTRRTRDPVWDMGRRNYMLSWEIALKVRPVLAQIARSGRVQEGLIRNYSAVFKTWRNSYVRRFVSLELRLKESSLTLA